MDLSRVHIVGSSCSGKTTFARKLGAVVSGRATATIWLDPPFVKILARFFKRSIRRSLTRVWIIQNRKPKRLKLASLEKAPPPGQIVIRLRTQKEIATFLERARV